MVMITPAIQEKHLIKRKINQENLQKARNLYYFLLFSFLLFLFSFCAKNYFWPGDWMLDYAST